MCHRRRARHRHRPGQDHPGKRLLMYRDADGAPRAIRTEQINAYLRDITGVAVSAKDFRMLHASALAGEALAKLEPGRARRRGSGRWRRSSRRSRGSSRTRRPSAARAMSRRSSSRCSRRAGWLPSGRVPGKAATVSGSARSGSARCSAARPPASLRRPPAGRRAGARGRGGTLPRPRLRGRAGRAGSPASCRSPWCGGRASARASRRLRR